MSKSHALGKRTSNWWKKKLQQNSIRLLSAEEVISVLLKVLEISVLDRVKRVTTKRLIETLYITIVNWWTSTFT